MNCIFKHYKNIKEALQQFIIDIGCFPHRNICDFDTKVISGEAGTFLRSHQVTINAAAAERQMQNGLVERHINNDY